MNKKTSSLLCVVIPFIFVVIMVLSGTMVTILDELNNNGMIFVIFALIYNTGALFVPIPGSILSIIGIKKAKKLRKQGEKTTYLIVIGIINILVFFVTMFMMMMSV